MHQSSNTTKTRRKALSLDELGVLIFMVAILFGSWFRLYPVFLAGFPINDGGLFYRMAQAILENNFLLPESVEYNGLEVPFAYPPFGLFLAALVHAVLDVPLILIFQYLPAIVLVITLFAFFSLADTLLESKLKAGLGTLIFAMLPRSMTWMIMGGGVTRSFGQLFLLLAVQNIYLLMTRRQRKYIGLAILFSSLVCLSHPEAALHTIGIGLILWLLKGRDHQGTMLAFGVAGGTLLATSIWWLPTLSRVGIAPFVSAAQTGLHSAIAPVYFLISLSEEPYLTVIAVLAIFGFAVKLIRRELLLPLWYVLPFFIEPRNAANVTAIPMALLACVALLDLIFPALAQIEGQMRKVQFQQSLQSRAEKGMLVYLGLVLLTGMLYYNFTIVDHKVSPENHEAFEWIAANTPTDSKFIVVTGNTDLFADWTLEWFPVLTNRVSQTTIQGREWLDGEKFAQRAQEIQLLQRCIIKNTPLACLQTQAKKLASGYDYIYIARKTSAENYATELRGDALILDITQSNENYTQVYRSNEVVIYQLTE